MTMDAWTTHPWQQIVDRSVWVKSTIGLEKHRVTLVVHPSGRPRGKKAAMEAGPWPTALQSMTPGMVMSCLELKCSSRWEVAASMSEIHLT